MPVLALNMHAGFACRHSGACCTAGWPIPVEPGIARRIRADSELTGEALDEVGALPDGAIAVIRPMATGACPFFEAAGGRLCRIQRRLGHDSIPASCRHFPRVALLEPDGVRVTLSHFCPTAAAMLFRKDVERLEIVPGAAGVADGSKQDGFDATRTIPPFLRPRVAMDTRTCRIWERYLVNALDSESLAPEDALVGVALAADAIRAWRPGPTSLEDHATRAVMAALSVRRRPGSWGMSLACARRLFLRAADSVPRELAPPGMPDGAASADRTWVTPNWTAFARPVGRYLAARSFGAWSAYLGEGLRTQVTALAVALAAVRIEGVRQTVRARRPLDEPLALEAIRSADLLLHHLSDPATLVRSLAGVERSSCSTWLAAMGLEAAP